MLELYIYEKVLKELEPDKHSNYSNKKKIISKQH